MSNLTEHAKFELTKAGYFDEKKDFYGGMTGNAVLELVEVFAKQGHSGMSAPMVILLFSKVANFEPISPIKCDDDEWAEDSDGTFQNKRLSSVFKDGKDGRPYYLEAIVWREENGGGSFTGTIESIASRQFIKLPFLPKTFYVDVTKDRKIINPKQLDAVFEYYEKP